MIEMNEWQKRKNLLNSSVNGNDEEDESLFNSNALLELNHDQFTWWYQDVFVKGMKSNQVFSSSFSNSNQE